MQYDTQTSKSAYCELAEQWCREPWPISQDTVLCITCFHGPR